MLIQITGKHASANLDVNSVEIADNEADLIRSSFSIIGRQLDGAQINNNIYFSVSEEEFNSLKIGQVYQVALDPAPGELADQLIENANKLIKDQQYDPQIGGANRRN